MVIKSPPLSSTLLALLLGLLAAQVIGTAQVYLSNIDLLDSLVIIRDAGYLPVPNEKIMPRLHEVGTAFWGAFFFTFTVGAGLSLLSLGAALIWDRIFLRRKSVLGIYLFFLAALLVTANYPGFSPLVSAYFLFVLPLVFIVGSGMVLTPASPLTPTLSPNPGGEGRVRGSQGPYYIETSNIMTGHGARPSCGSRAWVGGIMHSLPILLLSLLWATQVDTGFFTDLRDRLLLSNAAGKTVNDFYYKYNLYAAEVFKSLDQKMLKTCNLRLQLKRAADAVEWELISYDYLNVGEKKADLSVEEDSEILVLKYSGKEMIRTGYKEFMSNPGSFLKEFSRKSDRYRFFRASVFFGLWTFPLAIYIILHGLISIPLSFFISRSASSYAATTLCFCAGLFLLLFFYLGKEGEIKDTMIADSLASTRWQTRVAGLKAVEKHKMEIRGFKEYPSFLHSPWVAERYWLARALAASQRFDTLLDLRSLLADPSPNVVTQALYALGERKNQLVVQEILRFMKGSDHWYCQWYAYKSLRKLGWKQTRVKGSTVQGARVY